MKGLTDIGGIRVGHAHDTQARTGCTVILCERGAVAGLDARGSATGSEEWDLLNPLHLTGAIHAVVLAGGSAFGLEACSGVRRWLERKGIGYQTGAARVPLVTGAILYDLGVGRADVRPTREMGEAACAAASDGPVAEGRVGAGAGCTVGKALGIANSSLGGIGTYTERLGGADSGVLVSALVAVNAFGDVIGQGGEVVAGARRAPDAKEFVGTARAMKAGLRGGFSRTNTTLAVIATNAKLTKAEATKLAQLAQHGLVRTISPVHTTWDGDVVFALSAGEERADVNALGVAAADALAAAVLRAVKT